MPSLACWSSLFVPLGPPTSALAWITVRDVSLWVGDVLLLMMRGLSSHQAGLPDQVPSVSLGDTLPTLIRRQLGARPTAVVRLRPAAVTVAAHLTRRHPPVQGAQLRERSGAASAGHSVGQLLGDKNRGSHA